MAQVLHFPPAQEEVHAAFAELQAGLDQIQQSGNVAIRIANSLWAQQGCELLDAYVSLVRTCYRSLVAAVDYRDPQRACREINQWVEQQTEHKIRDLLAPGSLDASGVLVLVNAVYFKGKWQTQFPRSGTTDAAFYPAPSQPVQTPMMSQTLKTKYYETGSLQILELPYLGGSTSMILLLPKTVDGLDALEASLSADKVAAWRNHLREQAVQISLPRFTMTSCLGLDKVLQAMGMTDAFSLPPANFAGVTGGTDLYVSQVIHKAFVETNEEGTEATAATAVAKPAARGRGIKLAVFRADHPFLFLIQENDTGSILFLGRVADPTKS